MTEVVAFVGCMGSGKSYQAEKLLRHTTNGIHLNFADSLKALASEILQTDCFDDSFKSSTVGNITGRQFLQNLGISMRKRKTDFWVDSWYDEVNSCGKDLVVVSDVRFKNEVEAVIDLGGIFAFCDYRSVRYNNRDRHESERLAQNLLKLGYKDGDIIKIEDILCQSK